jgi:mannosyltransferase
MRLYPEDVEIIAPNLKRHLSGVTTTIVQLTPAMANRGLKIAAMGIGLPDRFPAIAARDLWRLWRKPSSRPFRIWHARRNVEMLAGIILRDLLRMPVRLVFTSVAQRHHKSFTRWLMRRMDRIVTTSERSAKFIHVPYVIVPHGVDTGRFRPAEVEEEDWAETGLPGRYGIGCFGRIRKQKGTDLFVDAMIDLLPSSPEWTAVISGRITSKHKRFADSLRQRIEAADLSERIVFLGEVEDITPWYKRISLCVAPSRNEGFGLTPLEAMASAKPVVASDAGAYPEMISPGVNGALVPAGDGAALRDAIRPYLLDPILARKHGQTALAFVRARFSLDFEVSGLREVYERIWAAQ